MNNVNKTAIVTGASGNLGQAIVQKFLSEDFRVAGTVTSNDQKYIKAGHEKFEQVIVDLVSEEASQKFVTGMVEKYNSVDVVVATVGGFIAGSVAETSARDILKQYRLNFETSYNVVRPAFLQMLKQNSGRIFLVGSRPGLDARYSKGMVAYSLAKSLVFRLAELLNEEAKGKNVVVSVVVPGTIDTPQNRENMPDADFSSWVTAASIADTIFYYCSYMAASVREPIIKLYNNA